MVLIQSFVIDSLELILASYLENELNNFQNFRKSKVANVNNQARFP